MKNNVICLFVDSVSWNSTSTHRAKISPTPFIDSLRKESLTASRLYSHGPYTDAAIRSLFTGRNCLDDFGYYYRLNTSPINDFKLFHDAGYETIGFYYPFIMHGHNIKRYIDHSFYTSGFIFASEWGGVFKYYSEKINKESLNETDILLLTNRLRLFFEVFETYLKDIRDIKDCRRLYEKCLTNFNVENALKTLEKEKNTFEEAPCDYIENFLKEGENHILWAIDTTSIDTLIDKNFLSDVVKRHKSFFRKIIRYNFISNLFFSFPSPNRIIRAIYTYLRTNDKSKLDFLRFYKVCLLQIRKMLELWNKPKWQVANSTHSILSTGIEIIKERNLGRKKPFYMSLLTEDPHDYLAMFAYDIQNKDEIDDEIQVLEDYVKKLKYNFKGSLLYLLSLRYVDYEIEKFCDQLKKMGLWNNTTIMIVSDHGSSFTFYPLRDAMVNCFNDECYHIPICIRHPGIHGVEIDRYCNSKDILPTVCNLVGIPQSPLFKGHSMLDRSVEEPSYVTTEYMGPGCPDMTSRRMWMSIRDDKYVVAYKVGIYENFDDGELAECYDLSKDPYANYNIANMVNCTEIDYLLIHLRDRFEEIKRDSLLFIDKLRENS